MLRQSQFDSLLTPGLYHHFDLGMTMTPTLRQNLFNVQSSSTATEKGTGMGGVSSDSWDVYQQTGGKGHLDFDQLYTKTYTHVEYPVRFRIEKSLMRFDQYGLINRMAQKVGISAQNKMERDAASVFVNAFTAGATAGADGVALCSASHPVSPAKSSGVYNNTGTSALSKDAVSTTRTEMMRFKDDKKEEIGVMPSVLLVPPELEDTALEITRSLQDPSSANNAINPQAGRWTVLAWHRLTDTNAWFMIDPVWMRMVLNWYEPEPYQIILYDEDTTELVYEAKLHYSFGFDDWRWIYGHNPS